MFFIPVTVSVRGSGILTAFARRTVIKAPVSGRVEKMLVRENQRVEKGATLFTIQSTVLEEEFSYLRQRRSELVRKLADLRQLVTICRAKRIDTPLSLHFPLYAQQYDLFRQQVHSASDRLENASRIFERNRDLYESEIVPAAEFDKYQYELEKARSDFQLIFEQQGSRWQTELNNLQLKLRELISERNKFAGEKELYTVRAPFDGRMQQVDQLRPGVFLSAGEEVGELSPDSGLIARVFISPEDIGLLREDMPVRFQIDAFNYHQWGIVEGSVSGIAGDVMLSAENSPVFEVKCSLNKTVLRLKNGYRGRLKKGMTLQARFNLTERTLFQLLYDNVDDWLNPYGEHKD